MRKGSGAVLIGLVVWVVGVGFSIWVSIIVEMSNPDWQTLGSPDCYLGAQVVLLSLFLSYMPFAVVGAAFVVPGVLVFSRGQNE